MSERVVSVVEQIHADSDQNSYEELLRQNLALKEQLVALRRYVGDLERSADMDPLVPVYNRRAFMRELSKAISIKQRFDIASCVVFIDLNNFKAMNDRYGHSIGDEILVKVGKCLQTHIRSSDLVARIGGDEFGVILFKSTLEEAQIKIQELNLKIESLSIDMPKSPVRVTAAFGAAPCRIGKTAEQVLAEADEAMYDAKLAERLNEQVSGVA